MVKVNNFISYLQFMIYNMIGKLQQQQYRMFGQVSKLDDPSMHSPHSSMLDLNRPYLQLHEQLFVGDNFHDIRKKSKRRQLGEEKKQLTNLFYDLITLVNSTYRQQQRYDLIEQSSQFFSPDINGSSRLHKRKNIKESKIIADNYLEGQANQMKGIQSNQYLSYPDHNMDWIKRPSQPAQIWSSKISGSKNQIIKKRPIFENYSVQMNYKMHFEEEQQEEGMEEQICDTKKSELKYNSFRRHSEKDLTNNNRKLSKQRLPDISVQKRNIYCRIYPQSECSVFFYNGKINNILEGQQAAQIKLFSCKQNEDNSFQI